MKKYWSCSKFADWLRGTSKPLAGTSKEWNAWEKKAKAKNFRYWLAEEGLDYLEDFVFWPANRINDEDWVDKNDPSYGQPTHQALAAQEIFKLYEWWKEERPKRPDPSDASGWSEHCEEKRNAAKANGDDSWCGFISNNTENERSVNILDLYRKIEKEQEDEDTAMLIRLIKIRQSLWT